LGKQVGELAKDLEIPMEELLQVLVKLGIEGKSESDVLEESEVDRVRIQLAGRRKAGTRRKTLARRGVQRRIIAPAWNYLDYITERSPAENKSSSVTAF